MMPGPFRPRVLKSRGGRIRIVFRGFYGQALAHPFAEQQTRALEGLFRFLQTPIPVCRADIHGDLPVGGDVSVADADFHTPVVPSVVAVFIGGVFLFHETGVVAAGRIGGVEFEHHVFRFDATVRAGMHRARGVERRVGQLRGGEAQPQFRIPFGLIVWMVGHGIGKTGSDCER